ncbi:MAG: hypothetical protein ACJ73S_11490 [Mycobacteriales bacterium]
MDSTDDPFPSLRDPHVRHVRQAALTTVTAACLALIPWICYLAASLPERHLAAQWRVAWVGFDIGLLGGLAGTAWAAWRRRQVVVLFALVTATLLVVDAWFDIVLSWGTGDLPMALISAAFGELPLAALMVFGVRRLILLTVRVARHRAGVTGPVPTFWRIPLFGVARPEDFER